MVWLAVEDCDFTGSARAFPARSQHSHAGSLDRLEDAYLGWNGDGEPCASQFDVERSVSDGGAVRLGGEVFKAQEAGRPVSAVAFDGGKKPLRTANVHLGVSFGSPPMRSDALQGLLGPWA